VWKGKPIGRNYDVSMGSTQMRIQKKTKVQGLTDSLDKRKKCRRDHLNESEKRKKGKNLGLREQSPTGQVQKPLGWDQKKEGKFSF